MLNIKENENLHKDLNHRTGPRNSGKVDNVSMELLRKDILVSSVRFFNCNQTFPTPHLFCIILKVNRKQINHYKKSALK